VNSTYRDQANVNSTIIPPVAASFQELSSPPCTALYISPEGRLLVVRPPQRSALEMRQAEGAGGADASTLQRSYLRPAAGADEVYPNSLG
jgi:hypothetical protein